MALTAAPSDSQAEAIVPVDENACTDSAAGDVPEKRSGERRDAPPQTIVKLYEHRCSYDSCPPRWSKFAKHKNEQYEREAEVRRVPIVQRYVYDQRNKAWTTWSFEINCPRMQAFLSEALADYPDLDMDENGWSFAPPYTPLVHRWQRIQELYKALEDPDKKGAVDKLMEFLNPRIAPSVANLAMLRETGMIAHDMIWQIFPPGEIVVRNVEGVDALYRVVTCGQSGNAKLAVEYVDWDGERCGLRETKGLHIPWYAGVRRITSLSVYPLSYADDPEQIKEAASARGRRFQQLRGYRFLYYDSVKISLLNEGEDQKRRVIAGQVVIDAHAYYKHSGSVKPEMKPLTAGVKRHDKPENEEKHDGGDGQEATNTTNTSHTAPPRSFEDLGELSDEDCLLTNPLLYGFDLKAKEWAKFLIDNLSEIEWNEKAFDNLVLPGGEKELAWEFVKSKAASAKAFDDFVPEKGRGLIILMFGPPGVGKTYTAEAVAEKARVPLYVTSAAVLGTKSDIVEKALDYTLELCRMWNAMLLLDEAKVFLGVRTDDNLNRNELVALFLTKLECYQGILFLTTNRAKRIDPAFRSRVDLLLPYNDLGAAARRQVWTNFLRHFGREWFDVETSDLERLAELPLNGCEIKNLIKSALLLDTHAGGRVTASRLYTLADMRVRGLKMLEEHNASFWAPPVGRRGTVRSNLWLIGMGDRPETKGTDSRWKRGRAYPRLTRRGPTPQKSHEA
ncbi:hypothetical protein VTH06DRAFT_7554 [Thermothelomyces fergusii]